MSEKEDTITYCVVKNHEGQFSIWPEYRITALPGGWLKTEVRGAKADCLSAIVHLATTGGKPTPPSNGASAARSVRARPTAVPFPKPDARFRLFVFPHAGSGASYYHFLARALKNDPVEVHVVQYPGREMRMQETPITVMESLVDLLLSELQPLLADTRFAFFGHSMGALTAYEMSHALGERNTQLAPCHLFLSGRQAPHLPGTNLDVEAMDDAAFLDAVGRRYRALPAELLSNTEIVSLILPSMRADFGLMERYRHRTRAPLDIPFTLLNGRDDIWFDSATIEEWARHTTRGIAVRTYPGDHFYMGGVVTDLRTLLLETLLEHRH